MAMYLPPKGGVGFRISDKNIRLLPVTQTAQPKALGKNHTFVLLG
ncbi:hypothetical protein [Flavobacterium sp. 38-13]|nr:hypothetical protein [Flavobacterium sp. 38-13]